MLSLTDDVRQNPAMLAELSREYEALKASKGRSELALGLGQN
jgi:hypothetical protein